VKVVLDLESVCRGQQLLLLKQGRYRAGPIELLRGVFGGQTTLYCPLRESILLPAEVGDETISIGSYPRAVDDEMVRSQAALKELNCSYSGAERLHVWRAIRAELE
jgi:hypothetical protein